jgi:hypothetical protein
VPLKKRYTWRVFSALKWVFADFEDEYVGLDLPHIPEPSRSEMSKELELRSLQLQMLLRTFHTRIRTGRRAELLESGPLAMGLWFRRYCPIELAVAEKTLFALPPINRIVPTTSTRMTASITAYSAMS